MHLPALQAALTRLKMPRCQYYAAILIKSAFTSCIPLPPYLKQLDLDNGCLFSPLC